MPPANTESPHAYDAPASEVDRQRYPSSSAGGNLIEDNDPNRRLRHCVYILVIAVAAGASLADILTVEKTLMSANDRSRWCTVWSLVHEGSFKIDGIIKVPGWDTIDKVYKDEHFYSSKPPLLATTVAGVYWALHRTVDFNRDGKSDMDLKDHTPETVAVILILINWLPWLISLGLMASLAERFVASDVARIVLVMTAAFGTLLTPFLVTFNNHAMAAAALVVSIWCVLPILSSSVPENQSRPGVWRFALGGFFAAFVVCNEMPAAAFGAALFLLLFLRAPKQTCLLFVPFACIPLGAFLYTNVLCTGSWKPFQMQYGTEIYRYVHEGIPSYWMNPGGIDQSKERPAVYFLHCVIGHHGIWSLSPILLLTFPGWWLGLRCPGLWRTVCGLSLGLTVWVLGFYLLRSDNYNYGGNTAGLRWAYWLIPLWLLAMVPALEAFGSRRGFVCLAGCLLSISVFSAAMPRDNPWRSPWLMMLMEQWGLVDYKSPPEEPPASRKVWLGKLPEKPGAWIEFRSEESAGASSLRIELNSIQELPGGSRASVTIQIDQPDKHEKFELPLSVSAFEAGEAPAKCLVVGEGESTIGLRFLAGLPKSPVYQGRALKYVKLSALRTNAFRCWQTVAEVDVPSEGGIIRRYRRDVWWTDEVPFGVLQFEDTVSDADKTVLYKQRWVSSGYHVP